MWSYNYVSPDELYHYGVVGMKWGKRKANSSLSSAKSNYKVAKKEYKKAFNKAYDRSVASMSPSKKHRQANDERWENAANASNKLRDAKSNLKAEKKNEKARIDAKKNEFVKNRETVRSNRSNSAKVVTNLLGGPFANKTYNSVIASGGSTRKARTVTAVAAMLGGPFGQVAASAHYKNKSAK